MNKEAQSIVSVGRQELPWWVVLPIVAYIASVVLLSYQEGLALVAKATGILMLSAIGVHAQIANRPLYLPVAFRLWIGWFVFALLTLWQATDLAVATEKAVTVAQILAVSLFVSNALIWNGSTRFYWQCTILISFLACCFVWANPTAFADGDGRVFGPLGNANAFGAMLVTGLVFVVSALLERQHVVLRVALAAASIGFFVMTLQTGSRQAVLGIFISLAILVCAFAYRTRKGLIRNLTAALAVGSMITAGVVIAATSEYWFRVEAALAATQGDMGDADSSLLDRVYLYKRAAQISLDHPFAGVGLDNFRVQPRFDGAGPIGTYSHSNYMEVLVSTGFPGFVLYFSVGLMWLWQLWRLRHLAFSDVEFGRYVRVTAIVLTYLAMDFATVSYYDKFVWLVMPWLVAEILDMQRLQVVRIPVSDRLERHP